MIITPEEQMQIIQQFLDDEFNAIKGKPLSTNIITRSIDGDKKETKEYSHSSSYSDYNRILEDAKNHEYTILYCPDVSRNQIYFGFMEAKSKQYTAWCMNVNSKIVKTITVDISFILGIGILSSKMNCDHLSSKLNFESENN